MSEEKREEITFNSLSRDHSKKGGTVFAAYVVQPSRFQLPLSGSHVTIETRPRAHKLGAFNSLSRDHKGAMNARFSSDSSVFQLPLSGSRDHIFCYRGGNVCASQAFNSLSRDHIPPTRKERPDIVFTLSTPSLGITEPDSGIFRLSAAFCRGTPSHK